MARPLHIAFIWHMHQPYYRDPVTRRCSMPWVRLHGTKDYLDMIQRLAPYPGIHQTFNLVPALIDQLEEYLPPQGLSDDFLDLSRKPAEALTDLERRFIFQWFFLANPERMIHPYPRYRELLALRGEPSGEGDWELLLHRATVQDVRDLQVWFNLAWIDPWLRRQDPRLQALEEQGARYTEADKQMVLKAQLGILAQVLPAYREAQARGQVELTTSPYYHPILPLLCDLGKAAVALPELLVPEAGFRYPDDALWHLTAAQARHAQVFGRRPEGCWPSEGSVSDEAVAAAIQSGLRWLATDEEILWRTLRHERRPEDLYRPHRVVAGGGETVLLFRDRELSDLLGFAYSRWEPTAAVDDLLTRLGRIHDETQRWDTPALVSIILDGENAWEHYPDDGQDFFFALYEGLSRDDRFRCVTVSEFLREHPPSGDPLPSLYPGSWIDANFATWTGHLEKNAAWALLAEARATLAPTLAAGNDAVRRSLAMAEGSDWFWWFGDTHVTAQAEEFDRLFRLHLMNAYAAGEMDAPKALKQPIRRPMVRGRGPTGKVAAVIDGRDTSYYEWLYAGRIDLTRGSGAMQRGGQLLLELAYGWDAQALAIRVSVAEPRLRQLAGWTLRVSIGPLVIVVTPNADTVEAVVEGASGEAARVPAAFHRTLELAVPRALLPPEPGPWECSLTLLQGSEVLEQHPHEGRYRLDPGDAHAAWSA